MGPDPQPRAPSRCLASRAGGITLPGPPLRFFDPDGAEQTFTGHLPPPVLGADAAVVRAWLSGETPLPEGA
ncbi:hypothetical protein GCM10023334_035440 [Nonomuraea thailandensis]